MNTFGQEYGVVMETSGKDVRLLQVLVKFSVAVSL